MKLRQFVTGSAVLLSGWLSVTFLHDVPSQRYPKLDKDPTATISPNRTADAAPVDSGETPVVQVSHSH